MRKQITDLIAQLQAIVAQVPAAMAADQWSALKPKVHEAVARYLQPQSKVEKADEGRKGRSEITIDSMALVC